MIRSTIITPQPDQKHSADGKVGDREKEWARHFITVGFTALEQVGHSKPCQFRLQTIKAQNPKLSVNQVVSRQNLSYFGLIGYDFICFNLMSDLKCNQMFIFVKIFICQLSTCLTVAASEDDRRHLLRWELGNDGRLLSCASGLCHLDFRRDI